MKILAERIINYFASKEIITEEELEEMLLANYDLVQFEKCTRVEVIDETGRAYHNRDESSLVKISLQDKGKTLKIFLIKRISLEKQLIKESILLKDMSMDLHVFTLEQIIKQQQLVGELLVKIKNKT